MVHVPHAAAVPISGVLPVGPVDQRVQAQALHWHSGCTRLPHFGGDVVQPGRAANADMAGLGHHQRPAIALPGLGQQAGERSPAGVAPEPVQPRFGQRFPLAAVVVVHAQQVQAVGAAAQVGFQAAAQQVPGLPLPAAHHVGLCLQVGPVGRGHHVHQRLHVQEAGTRVNLPHGLHGSQRRAYQAALDDVATGACGVFIRSRLRRAVGRKQQAGVGRGPGQKADFVDRRVDGRMSQCVVRCGARRACTAGAQQTRHFSGEARQARDHRVVVQAQVAGQAVVHQRP